MGETIAIEGDVYNIAQAVYDYDPNLKLQYLPPERAGVGDAPYRLMELCKDGVWRKVFDIWVLDDRVLTQLYAIDTQKHDILANLDKQNAGVRREGLRRYRDFMDEAKDITAHIIRSPKTRYTVNLERDNEKRKVTFE